MLVAITVQVIHFQ
jgi:hypothetical protein